MNKHDKVIMELILAKYIEKLSDIDECFNDFVKHKLISLDENEEADPYIDNSPDPWANPVSTVRAFTPSISSPWRIERAKNTVVFGPSGMITEWLLWSSFETEKRRDEEFEELRRKHPNWSLRKSYQPNYFVG